MPRRPLLWLLAVASILVLVAAGCGGGDDDEDEGGSQAAEQTITFALGAEPPSLDPALATDTTSANVLLNIMDPLVTLEGEDLEATPGLAESWEASEDGTVYTFNLRADGKWTNGDPVTAEQFEWSWKRVLDPETAAEYAYQLYGIKGAQEYNECEKNCDALADQVGVEAVDERTLRVTLTSAQPWFPQVVSHHIFLAVPQATVEQHGKQWTEAQNIVTNGAYRLATWEHESRLDLVKWPEWRAADEVSITRVNGRIITEGTTALQAFEAGEVDLLDPGLIPTAEVQRVKETPEWYAAPSLATYYYGFNTKNITDVDQRRAMSLAIDRRTIVDRITQAGEEPTTGFTPAGIAGFDTINPESKWLPENGDVEQAKQLMQQVDNPKRDITLIYNNSPGHKEIAVAIQGMWKEIGINAELKQQEWAQFLEFIGPPPNDSVDVFRLGWLYDYPDALNGLELWTCESGNNSTNWCNKEFDRGVDDARATPDDAERYEKYAELEQILVGDEGELPVIPIYWYTNTTLVKEKLRDSFSLNPQGFIEFRDLEVAE